MEHNQINPDCVTGGTDAAKVDNAVIVPATTNGTNLDHAAGHADAVIAPSTTNGATTNGVTTNGATTNGVTTNGATTNGANLDHTTGAADADKVDVAATAPATTNGKKVKPPRDAWYYPPDIANDLQGVDLPAELKAEAFACAWEYTRCVIPQYTNWSRYVAFMRIIVMGIIAEFRGSLVDVTAGDNILGYDLSATLAALFEGTPGHEDMAREYRTFLLITADKASDRRQGELFRRYVNALAQSPRHWFRMRDCDALARFTIASALACNDLDDVWFTDEQFEILTEIGDTLYDAVAFYKHRSEGETNSTFAYMPQDLRIMAFRKYREILWALDVAWARQPERQGVINFVRFFGGPIHMMMRRYRFVEEDLTIGKPETEQVVAQTRQNFKLWNRVDANKRSVQNTQRYKDLIARSHQLMFPGLAEYLEQGGDGHCDRCRYRASYGAEASHRFGGVELCDDCRVTWRDYLESFQARAEKVFPELVSKKPALSNGDVVKDEFALVGQVVKDEFALAGQVVQDELVLGAKVMKYEFVLGAQVVKGQVVF